MSALTEFLFPVPPRRTPGAIVRWWEARRLAYNLIVGSAGVVSLAAVNVIAWLPPQMPNHRLIPWQGVVAFAVMANVCYLLGPVVDVLVTRLWGRQLLPVGPALFRMGLTFSVGLALLPTLMMLIGWVARIVMAAF